MGSCGATDRMPSAVSSARTKSQHDALCQPPCTRTAVVMVLYLSRGSRLHRLAYGFARPGTPAIAVRSSSDNTTEGQRPARCRAQGSAADTDRDGEATIEPRR